MSILQCFYFVVLPTLYTPLRAGYIYHKLSVSCYPLYCYRSHSIPIPSRNTKEGLKGSIMPALELDGNLLQYDDEWTRK